MVTAAAFVVSAITKSVSMPIKVSAGRMLMMPYASSVYSPPSDTIDEGVETSSIATVSTSRSTVIYARLPRTYISRTVPFISYEPSTLGFKGSETSMI